MIDKKQSSINYLKSKLITRQNTHIIHGEEVIFISLEKLNNLFEQAKEMHKDEVENAWLDGLSKDELQKLSATKYYQQTYGED